MTPAASRGLRPDQADPHGCLWICSARLVGQIGCGRFAARLEAVQHALNAAFAEAIARAQAKGLITPDHDPLALAVFIQAYTMGRVLGDLDSEPVDPAAWNALIGDALDAVVRPRR